MDAERAQVAHLATRLRAGLAAMNLGCGDSTTQIVPILIGDAEQTLRVAADLERRGILAVAIRPPTVPEGTSRLRIALTSGHTERDVENLLNALGDALC